MASQTWQSSTCPAIRAKAVPDRLPTAKALNSSALGQASNDIVPSFPLNKTDCSILTVSHYTWVCSYSYATFEHKGRFSLWAVGSLLPMCHLARTVSLV